MAFDWFRRRFSESPEPANPTPEPDPQPDPNPPAATEDLLAFAKAAYANIKAREEKPADPAPDPTSASQSVPEPEPLTEDPAPDPITPEITLETPVNLIPDPEMSSSVELALEDPQPEPARPKAFFDLAPRATERLVVLESTAVIEPEVEAPSLEPELDLGSDFDAGFRWSAEILAAQGRRPEDISVEEITWLQKLQRGLGKTRLNLINQLKALVGRGPIDQDAVDEIETLLLQSDVGVNATDRIIAALQSRMRQEVLPPEEAVRYLKHQMQEMLTLGNATFAPERDTLNIWLIVGVNGAGKTTTIGKIAHVAQKSGYRCLVAAGDTFRAAAVEQLKIWGERSNVEVVANPGQNTDPAAVVFDAITAAQTRNTELLLVDTAGRLQNKKNLMDELTKIRRIIDKKAPNANVESLLVLDSTLGQNGLRQAEVFAQAAQLSGVVLTKLDSTAKGGIAFAITQQLNLPIRFIGAGEGIEDLRPFSSYEFVEALLSEY